MHNNIHNNTCICRRLTNFSPNPAHFCYGPIAFPLSAFAAGGRGSAAVRVAGSAKLLTSLVPLAQLAHLPFSISRACRIL